MVAARLMHMVAARLMPNLLDAMEPSGSPDEGAGKRGPPSLSLELCCPPASVVFKTPAVDHYRN